MFKETLLNICHLLLLIFGTALNSAQTRTSKLNNVVTFNLPIYFLPKFVHIYQFTKWLYGTTALFYFRLCFYHAFFNTSPLLRSFLFRLLFHFLTSTKLFLKKTGRKRRIKLNQFEQLLIILYILGLWDLELCGKQSSRIINNAKEWNFGKYRN